MTLNEFLILDKATQQSIKNEWKIVFSCWRSRVNGKWKRLPIDWEEHKKKFHFRNDDDEADLKFGVDLWNYGIAKQRKIYAMMLRKKENEETNNA